jgi:hypothetical protein
MKFGVTLRCTEIPIDGVLFMGFAFHATYQIAAGRIAEIGAVYMVRPALDINSGGGFIAKDFERPQVANGI